VKTLDSRRFVGATVSGLGLKAGSSVLHRILFLRAIVIRRSGICRELALLLSLPPNRETCSGSHGSGGGDLRSSQVGERRRRCPLAGANAGGS